MANIGSINDIQNLFKETIAEFTENGLEAELMDELGYSTTPSISKVKNIRITGSSWTCTPIRA